MKSHPKLTAQVRPLVRKDGPGFQYLDARLKRTQTLRLFVVDLVVVVVGESSSWAVDAGRTNIIGHYIDVIASCVLAAFIICGMIVVKGTDITFSLRYLC